MRMLAVALILLGGCSPFCLPGTTPQPEQAAAPMAVQDSDSPLPLLVSIKDLMGGAIAFSAHVIDQIHGSETPMTNGDWGAARVAASDLIATATLLTMPNNNMVDTLRKHDDEWRPLAKALQDAGINAAAAAQAKDKARRGWRLRFVRCTPPALAAMRSMECTDNDRRTVHCWVCTVISGSA